MKIFKLADCIIQGLLLFFAAALIALFSVRLDETLFSMYFVLGGWQVISMLIHLFVRGPHKSGLRKLYHILLVLTIVGAIFSLTDDDFFLTYMAIMLGWTPILALLYFVCCCIETRRMTLAESSRQPVS